MEVKYIFAILISAVISYLLGSCNFSIITVRLLKGEDIRNFGSGNAGLTNTLRCFGKLPAALTLAGDLLKGVVAVFISKGICILLGTGLGPENDVHFIGYVAGFFAVIGHILPIYYGFKGGKGVLVGVSLFLAIDPLTFAVLILIFAIVLTFSKYVSLSSITGAAFSPIITLLMQYFVSDVPLWLAAVYAVMNAPIAALVIYMHKSNIERLKNGTENRFSFSSKNKEK